MVWKTYFFPIRLNKAEEIYFLKYFIRLNLKVLAVKILDIYTINIYQNVLNWGSICEPRNTIIQIHHNSR